MKQLGTVLPVLLILMGNGYAEGSGEAILKGLEKAAAREAEMQQGRQATTTVPGTRSFTCARGTLVRKISVDYPAPDTGLVCRVLYETEKGLEIPWRATNTRDYCAPQAVGLTKKLMQLGWECTED